MAVRNGLRMDSVEEITNIESGKLDRPTSSRPKSSRPTSSRVQSGRTQYARRLKSANLVKRRQHQQTGGIARPNTRCKSARSGINRVRSARKRDSYSEDKSCELSLNIKVSQLSTESEEDTSSNQAKRDLAERFYDVIIQKKEQFCWTLEAAINIRDVRVETITRGSLCVKCECLTLGALESLNQMFKSRRLSAVCQSVFVTDSVRDLIGVRSVKLDVTIDTAQLDASREVLLSRKFKECTSVHPADTLTTPTNHTSLDHIPVTTDVVVIEKDFDVVGWRMRLSTEVEAVRHRYTGFSDSIDIFIRTLQIIMPKGKVAIESLSDVIGLYAHLMASSSLSSGVRTDLIREYLSTVNSIRILVDDIKAKSFHATNDKSDDDYQIMTCLVSELQDMLLAKHVFEEDISVLDRRINPAEKPFLGLLCFVPLLLAKLSTVLYTLSAPGLSK
ncbi:uncharacterized protein LOC117334704 isoform X2 [Pecten maximus]|uniref:uncharacterized protein LOC117334704 isoform X2 n=1 Tax=Pecten maximus TaxID=6579 RepID=UPI0014585C54|nr:uncharacterized protein LOC117334704 isoform X2 [Pecten maximus]